MHNLLRFWLLHYSIEHRNGKLFTATHLCTNTFVTGRALKQIESLYQLRILCVRFLCSHAVAASPGASSLLQVLRILC